MWWWDGERGRWSARTTIDTQNVLLKFLQIRSGNSSLSFFVSACTKQLNDTSDAWLRFPFSAICFFGGEKSSRKFSSPTFLFFHHEKSPFHRISASLMPQSNQQVSARKASKPRARGDKAKEISEIHHDQVEIRDGLLLLINRVKIVCFTIF